jgi:hypothetical protein
VEAARRGGGEIRQEREALGLGHDRPGSCPVAARVPNIDRAKGPDPKQSGHCWFYAQDVTCRVTDRGRSGDGSTAYWVVIYGRLAARTAQSAGGDRPIFCNSLSP